eukprot:scaffold43479_cov24-Prasinocladus_malaysianus.AAC.1
MVVLKLSVVVSGRQAAQPNFGTCRQTYGTRVAGRLFCDNCSNMWTDVLFVLATILTLLFSHYRLPGLTLGGMRAVGRYN